MNSEQAIKSGEFWQDCQTGYKFRVTVVDEAADGTRFIGIEEAPDTTRRGMLDIALYDAVVGGVRFEDFVFLSRFKRIEI